MPGNVQTTANFTFQDVSQNIDNLYTFGLFIEPTDLIINLSTVTNLLVTDSKSSKSLKTNTGYRLFENLMGVFDLQFLLSVSLSAIWIKNANLDISATMKLKHHKCVKNDNCNGESLGVKPNTEWTTL